MKEKEVFIIGAKGIPARYGGFESFFEQLTLGRLQEMVELDIYYIRKLNVVYDLYILLRTVWIMLKPNQAY